MYAKTSDRVPSISIRHPCIAEHPQTKLFPAPSAEPTTMKSNEDKQVRRETEYEETKRNVADIEYIPDVSEANLTGNHRQPTITNAVCVAEHRTHTYRGIEK